MKLRYERPKGCRVKYGYLWIECDSENLWWHAERRVWEPLYTHYGTYRSGTPTPMCRSPKAFVRLLKKWSSYIPSGTKFRLVSVWRGYNVTGAIPKACDA